MNKIRPWADLNYVTTKIHRQLPQFIIFYYFFNTTNIQQLIYNRTIIEQYNFNIIFETEREKPKSTAQDYNE
jgi:hypothetical protein